MARRVGVGVESGEEVVSVAEGLFLIEKDAKNGYMWVLDLGGGTIARSWEDLETEEEAVEAAQAVRDGAGTCEIRVRLGNTGHTRLVE